MGKALQPLAAGRAWNVSTLLGETFRLLWRHIALFAPLAVITAVPPLLLVHLLWGEDAANWGVSTASVPEFVIGVLLTWVVAPALMVTAFVVAVVRIAEGRRPSVAEVVRAAAPRALPVAGTIVLQYLAMVAGLIALVIPGLYVTTLVWLAPQAAAAEERDPVSALKRSAALVKGRWWQTTGRLLLMLVVIIAVTMPLAIVYEVLDYGAVYILVDLLAMMIVYSFTAVFATLLLLDYRTAGPEPAAGGGFEPPRPPDPVAL